jgi:hypothetical protein
VDGTAYSSIAADTTHQIVKQGILLDSSTLSCPAPGTTGQSINYLIEVAYQDLDVNPVVLPYYNASNPSQAYSGPSNSGVAQNTSRRGVAVIQVKAGASATTGSQVTPAPDAGFVGLYVVTVAFGQTTITSGNISQYSGAPLIPGGLLQAVQNASTTGGTDIGTANAYAANFTPAITALTDKMVLCIKAVNANTAASTFTPAPGVIATAPIVGGNHSALQGGEIAVNGDVWLQWNSSIGAGSWVLIDSTGGGMQIAPATKSQHALQLAQATGRLLRTSVYRNNAGTLQVSIDGAAFANVGSTFTALALTTSVIVQVLGGGGGGGGAAPTGAAQTANGSGGGAGGYGKSRILSGFSGVTVAVGAGGTASAGVAGGNGGTSSFGGLISSAGGQGGVLGAALPTSTTAPVGQASGGTSTGGNMISSTGSTGKSAFYSANNISGTGGDSVYGGGAAFVSGISSGNQAVSPGSGGSGAALPASSGSAAGGGAGAGGLVTIEEYA